MINYEFLVLMKYRKKNIFLYIKIHHKEKQHVCAYMQLHIYFVMIGFEQNFKRI